METSFDLTWLENPNKSEIPDAPLMKLGGNGPRTCIGRNILLVGYYLPSSLVVNS
jgi:hypothetical protein